jgi:hypothetical protein
VISPVIHFKPNKSKDFFLALDDVGVTGKYHVVSVLNVEGEGKFQPDSSVDHMTTSEKLTFGEGMVKVNWTLSSRLTGLEDELLSKTIFLPGPPKLHRPRRIKPTHSPVDPVDFPLRHACHAPVDQSVQITKTG